MFSVEDKKNYYQALIDKNSEYEGIFYVGVITTGIFCRPSCPAKKPKFEHCEFFKTPKEALLASYRPCKRCHPLSQPNSIAPIIELLIDTVEQDPQKRWREEDFQELSISGSTVRRQFKKRFNMTFVGYARARRMGIAMKQIRSGSAVIDAQLSVGYESSSGFRDAFSRTLGAAPTLLGSSNILKSAWIDTPLGPMIVISDEKALYLLEFVDRRGLEREIERLKQKTKSIIIPGSTDPIVSIQEELGKYFDNTLESFKTPIVVLRTLFQKHTWKQLMKIPIGQTCSYADIAKKIDQPLAYRAVARANGSNQLSIIIPCHRVINTNGDLGGYGGGIERKRWLLCHEKNTNFI